MGSRESGFGGDRGIGRRDQGSGIRDLGSGIGDRGRREDEDGTVRSRLLIGKSVLANNILG